MKIERQDTTPLAEDDNDFSRLLLGEGSLQMPRFDTAVLTAVEQMVESQINPAPISPPIIPPSSQQNTIVIQENGTNGFTEENLHEMENLVNQDEPITWPEQHNIQFLDLLDINTKESMNYLVRGLTLPGPSTAPVKQEQPISTMPPTLKPWPGNFNFNISITPDTRDRNRMSYSAKMEKLFVCPNYTFPVSVSVNQWEGATITVMAAFKQSQYSREPVTPCHNCKSTYVGKYPDHIVQVEGGEYTAQGDHGLVTVPLNQPAIGEINTTLLVKLICLTSCVGGPSRRPMCLVFCLNLNGAEVGRQVLDVKCCRCPLRDMNNEDHLNKMSEKQKVRKVNVSEACTDYVSKRLKTEQKDSSEYTYIKVPKKIEAQVKTFINQLEALEQVQKTSPHLLPFPPKE